MKKLLTLLLTAALIFSISSVSFSQTEWGITGGVNYATMDFTSGINFDELSLGALSDETAVIYNELEGETYKFGFNGGVYAMMDLGAISFNPSLIFSMKGNKTDNYNTHLNYVSLPLLIGFQPFDLLHIQLGPEFGYLSNVAVDPAGGDKYNVSDSDFYNNIDYGAVIGILLDLPGKLDLTARYTHGLGSVYEPVVSNNGDELKFQNRVFQFGLQYPIGYKTNAEE